MRIVSVIKDGVKGKGIIIRYFDKWQKKNDIISYRTKTGTEGVKWEIDPEYKNSYANLSNRKKDKFNKWIEDIAREKQILYILRHSKIYPFIYQQRLYGFKLSKWTNSYF